MFNLISRFASARILVVDDSVFERRLIMLALKKAGFFKIETACDGEHALEKTYEFKPDLVLLDLNMPRRDGFGYCEYVRNDPNLPRMPIIVQTALEDRDSRLRALSCGADDFLLKPLDMSELTLRIRVQIERYFMLRDLSDMCGYLRMELEQSRDFRAGFVKAGVPDEELDILDKHYEVLAELVEYSAMAE